MKRIRTKPGKIMPERILSIVCITGMITLAGAATACTSDTAATTQDTSAVTETDNTTQTAAADNTSAAATADTDANQTTDPSAAADTAAGITLEEAKTIALADAGLAASDVTYTAEGQDTDNGVAVYEIDFFTASTEYDYEIRVSDGTILEKSTEAFQTGSTNASGVSSDSCISVDEAKSIVLNQAGLSSADVTFRKALLERDDGIMVYEIEFYYGRTEYEYTVNSETGDIMEYDAETD